MSFIKNKFNLLKTFIQFDFLDKKKSKLQSIKIIFQIIDVPVSKITDINKFSFNLK